jgi:hypothetical protein
VLRFPKGAGINLSRFFSALAGLSGHHWKD